MEFFVNNWLFSSKNIYMLGMSLALLIVGYVLLAQGPVDSVMSTTVAPIILVAVYCGLIPYAMLSGYGKGGGKGGGKGINRK
jgi:hypothetical protein